MEGKLEMKELGNTLAQLAAIIMILITIAIWTAAASQWASAASEDQPPMPAQSSLVHDAR